MKEKKLWHFVKKSLTNNKKVVLLVVVQSKGSSPGRAGFKMAVTLEGESCGTIGGGNVEYMMLEKVKQKMMAGQSDAEIIRQVHNPDAENNSSGMICSGEQTTLLFPMQQKHRETVKQILDALDARATDVLTFTPAGMQIAAGTGKSDFYTFQFKSENDWQYGEVISKNYPLYIFGAGHVCMELCEILKKIDFDITIVDDRADFDMLKNNPYAQQKMVQPYDRILHIVDKDQHNFFVIMTHSHAGDAVVLKQLIDQPFAYLGMMGSPKKVAEIYGQLKEQGVNPELFKKVNSPIGVQIKSKTAEEIAISIAAELVHFKNK